MIPFWFFLAGFCLMLPTMMSRVINAPQAPFSAPASSAEPPLGVEQLLNQFLHDPPKHILDGVGLSPGDYEGWEDQREWMYFIRLQHMGRLRKEVHRFANSMPDFLAPPALASSRPERMGKRQVVLDPSDPLLASSASTTSSEGAAVSSIATPSSTLSSSIAESSSSAGSGTVSAGARATSSTTNAALATAIPSITTSSTQPAATVAEPGAALPVLGQEEQVLVEVVESNTQLDTPVGPMIQQCLTMVSDPSQSFCRTLLNGEAIGSDAGFGRLPVAAAAPNSTGNATSSSSSVSSTSISAGIPSESPQVTQISQTSSSVVVSSAATSISASSAVSSSRSAETSVSVDFVVNAATTSDVPIPSASTSASDESFASSSTATALPISETASNIAPSDTASSSAAPGIIVPENAQATAAMISIAAASASAAAAARAEAEAVPALKEKTEIPGQRMSVLPIGLGVFGGLAGIALLVVGYVMWERKKYRSQFVRRKEAEKSLANQEAAMGGSGYDTGGGGRRYDV